MISRPCLGPPDPGVHPRGQNIAYDLALVKLGPHNKFGEDLSNSVYFYTGHTHTHTHRSTFIYKISPSTNTIWYKLSSYVINAGIINECLPRAIFSTILFEGKAENRNVELDTKMLLHSDGLTWKNNPGQNFWAKVK